MSIIRLTRASALAAALGALPAPTLAQERALDLSGAVTIDVASAIAGDGDRDLRLLTNVDLTADADLAALLGWDGGRAHVYVLDNRGARPNDAAATLQGVDNIEVPGAGLRLFEAWVEQDLGRGATLRLGLYDLNSEFYTNEAAGLLIAPPFGIGSELAVTGPNGPSIFPSSALSARLRVPVGGGKGYVQVAALNARAGTLGDDGGIDFSFTDGLLLIGEAGLASGPLRGSVGVWGYTERRDDLFERDTIGQPLRETARGAYLVLEGDLLPAERGRQLTAFLRVGLSDPHTSPFTGGFQTGLLLAPALVSRPDSALSIGLHHAWVSDHFRTAFTTDGGDPAHGETALELTYADQIIRGLTLQPDVQWIRNPGADAAASDTVMATVRIVWAF